MFCDFLYFTLFKIAIMATVKEKDVRDEIREWLKKEFLDLMWLHRKTEIPYGTLYSCFKQKYFNLSQKNLDKINEVTEQNFEF